MKKSLNVASLHVYKKMNLPNDVTRTLCKQDILLALNRHYSCDWGDVNDLEWLQNDRAFKSGEKVLSRYISSDGIPFEIVSEPENTNFMILLPAAHERKVA